MATSSDSHNNAQINRRSIQSSFDQAATAITTGWIVGIVLLVLSGIVCIVLFIYVYRRNKKRRERGAQLNGEPKPNPGDQAASVGMLSTGYYGGPSELAGQYVPLRHEAPNAQVPPRELPNNEVVYQTRSVPNTMKAISVALVLACSNLTQCTLEVFQAAPPPRSSFNEPACRQLLFEHDFGNSYGAPYIGPYSPPSSCNFTTAIFNLSVVSSGRQYDRLATLWLGDVEVWRTSTTMPVQSGIHWSFRKDMTIWHPLLIRSQKLIFDLGNLIDGDRYIGFFNVTMEALYYDDDYVEGFHPAGHIYPLSTLSSLNNTTSLFSLPGDSGLVNLTLRRNIKNAVVSLTAYGNGEEEFWFTNVPAEYVNTFPGNEGWLYGYSPFREV
ncbi:hypothetical protein AAE478_005793 [Parahypoxylon ruwenzoriense]